MKLSLVIPRNPNEMCNEFTEKLHEIIANYIPMKQKRVKYDQNESFISEITFDLIM